MPDKKKTILNEKFYSWLLVIVFALTFVTAIMLSLTLPFVNVQSKVASAYSPNYQGVLEQSASGLTLRNVPSDVTSLCALFFNVGFVPDFSTWDLPYGPTQLFKYEYQGDTEADFNEAVVNRMTPDSFNESFGVKPSHDTYLFVMQSKLDSYFMGIYCTAEDKTILENAGLLAPNAPIPFSYKSAYGEGRIVNFTSFTVNSTYIDKLVSWVSLSCSFEASGSTTIVEEVLSPEYFATRFVTPSDSPSNSVFFNLSILPKAPKLADFESYSSGAIGWYYYDYFEEYGADGSSYGANDVNTVGWHVSVHKEVSPPVTTILGYYVSLRIKNTDIYSYYVSGSNFDTGAISDQKWLVSSNYTFGDLKLYKYDFSGATSYYSLLPHVDGKTRPIDSQFGADGWSSWLALFDLSNFASLSNDVYINMGYSQAKAYYDELIKSKSQESFLQGKAIGYDLGYQEGKLEGGDYTFTSLIGAVFDAPISAFRGLFNFEILGVNMQGFVLALLTLSVIIIVIRFALGGK